MDDSDQEGSENGNDDDDDDEAYDDKMEEIFDVMFEHYQNLQSSNSRRKKAALLSQEETEADLTARETAESQHDRFVSSTRLIPRARFFFLLHSLRVTLILSGPPGVLYVRACSVTRRKSLSCHGAE